MCLKWWLFASFQCICLNFTLLREYMSALICIYIHVYDLNEWIFLLRSYMLAYICLWLVIIFTLSRSYLSVYVCVFRIARLHDSIRFYWVIHLPLQGYNASIYEWRAASFTISQLRISICYCHRAGSKCKHQQRPSTRIIRKQRQFFFGIAYKIRANGTLYINAKEKIAFIFF